MARVVKEIHGIFQFADDLFDTEEINENGEKELAVEMVNYVPKSLDTNVGSFDHP